MKRIFTAILILFFILGFITLLDVARYIQEFGAIPWLFVGYAGLNLLRGIGFVMRERWLLYLFGLHAICYTLLGVISTVMGLSPGLVLVGVNILLSWGLWVLLYRMRHELADTKWSWLEAVVFLSIWVSVFYYTAMQIFIR